MHLADIRRALDHQRIPVLLHHGLHNRAHVIDMTVGLNSTVAPAWAASTVVATGAKRTNGANIYNATVGGTTAASGGPTGTGASIADNTVTWAWYCVANAEVQMDNIDLAITQVVNINSVVITHG